MNKLNNDVNEIFNLINEELKSLSKTAQLVLIGGQLGVYHLGEEEYRKTHDIDVIHKYDDKDFIELLSQYGIEQVGVMQLPPYEDLTDENNCEVISYSNLKVLIPDIEMFAVSKLMTTRGKDLNDLESTNLLKFCDKKRLIKLIDEYKRYSIDKDHSDINVKQLERLLENL